MAQKITSKNLSYDDSLPPFLARLRNQHASSSAEPDPILASRRRAAKPRSASEEAEDGPLVVDEEGVTVSGVTVGKDGTVTEHQNEDEGDDDESRSRVGRAGDTEKAKEENVAAIGAGKKRKIGKIVGGGDDDEEEGSVKASSKDIKTTKSKTNDKSQESSKAGKKKKAKKIKLSFGDEEGN